MIPTGRDGLAECIKKRCKAEYNTLQLYMRPDLFKLCL